MEQIISLEIYSFLFIFFRLGGAIMFMPVFMTAYISERQRLSIALAISLVLVPFLQNDVIIPPNNLSEFFKYSIFEITYGIFIGLFTQLLLYITNVLGNVAGTAIGFANAQFFNPATQTPSIIIESFVTILALTLIVTLDIHHLMISAVIDSYNIFPFGSTPPIGDMTEFVTKVVSESFLFGFKIASPFIAFTLVFYSCMGLFSRLMPQLNIFFLSIPLQIYLGLGLLFITIPIIMMWFLQYFQFEIEKFIK